MASDSQEVPMRWVILRALVCGGFLMAAVPARAQKPDVTGGRTAVDNFATVWEDGIGNTTRLIAAEKERNGPCQEVLLGIHARELEMLQAAQRLAAEMTAVMDQIEPITDIRAEVEAQRQQLTMLQADHMQVMQQVMVSQQSLDSIRQGQQEAIAEWMLENYAADFGPQLTIELPQQTVVVTNTLFGAFVVTAPRKLQIPEQSETTVRFTPALFSDELFPDAILIGPVGTSRSIPNGFQFNPGKVVDGQQSRPFKMEEGDQLIVNGKDAIAWHWETNATDKFQGADFSIQMGARRNNGTTSGQDSRMLELPVKIDYDPGKPFAEKYGSIIAAAINLTIGSLIGFSSAFAVMYFGKRIDREDKAKEREREREVKRQADAEAERKRAEELRRKLRGE
jgi:hypothetical protein